MQWREKLEATLLIFYRRAWRRQKRDGSDRRHAPNVPLSRSIGREGDSRSRHQENEQAPPVEELAGPDEKKSRRRPTLAGPIVRLPLARQRFTSGFGTGPGGTTALWPPGFRGKRAFFLFILPAREPLGGFEGDFLRVVVCVAKKISSRYEGKESA